MFEDFFKNKNNFSKKMENYSEDKEKVYLLDSKSISNLRKNNYKSNVYSNGGKIDKNDNIS